MPSLNFVVVVIYTLLASEVLCQEAEFDYHESKICPSYTELSDVVRKNFTDTHNYRRSQLAQGKVPNMNGNYFRAASNMIKLEWECTLEKNAIDYVRNCPDMESEESEGVLYKRVNDSMIVSAGDIKAAALMAVKSWWSIARKVPVKDCIGKDAKFEENFKKKPIKSFTQMAWAETTKLGCAIGKCKFEEKEEYVVACHYSPKGNIVNQKVYIPGPACTGCPGGYTCTTPSHCDQQNCKGLCVRRY